MDAQLKSIEVEPAFVGDDEFAVECALCGKVLAKRVDHFGKVSIERFLISALDKDVIAFAKDEDAKAIPLGFIDPFALGRHLVDTLGKHGEDGRADGKIHGRVPRKCTEVQMRQSSCAVVRPSGSVG